ncbi:MAG: hypothetical protein HKM07_06135 [Chlamydiae bacterium]|nr:hypothetical protein [Chlamydiota bacterium]
MVPSSTPFLAKPFTWIGDCKELLIPSKNAFISYIEEEPQLKVEPWVESDSDAYSLVSSSDASSLSSMSFIVVEKEDIPSSITTSVSDKRFKSGFRQFPYAILTLLEKIDNVFCKAANYLHSTPLLGPVLALGTRGIEVLVLAVVGAVSFTALAVGVIASAALVISALLFAFAFTIAVIPLVIVFGGLAYAGISIYMARTSKESNQIAEVFEKNVNHIPQKISDARIDDYSTDTDEEEDFFAMPPTETRHTSMQCEITHWRVTEDGYEEYPHAKTE